MDKNLILFAVVTVLWFGSRAAFSSDFQNFKASSEDLKISFEPEKPASPSITHMREGESLLDGSTTSQVINSPQVLKSASITEDSELYQKILNELDGNRYQEIGEQEAGNILSRMYKFDLGKENFSGFNWQKPMGYFRINVDRQLAPDLMHDTRYIVTDLFTIEIDASTFLSNLKDEGAIEITETQLGLFAGVTFKRQYRFVHLEEDFKTGLTSDYSKLFMSFLKFRGFGLKDMQPQEFLTKEDYLSARAGGMITTPAVYYVSASAGIMAEFDLMSRVLLQGVSPEEERYQDEFLRVSVENEKSLSIQAKATVQADFFKLLQLTLLSYDYTYKASEQKNTYLSFAEDDREKLVKDHPVGEEVKKLLTFRRADIKGPLKEHLVSRELRKKEDKNSNLLVLLWGQMKKVKTEQVTIIKNDEEHWFFKSHGENIKYAKSLVGNLVGALFKVLFKKDSFEMPHKAAKIRRVSMEYKLKEYQKELSPKEITLDSEEKMSFTMSQEYMAKKTTKWWNKIYKKHALGFIDKFSDLSEKVKQAVDDDYLQGPMKVLTKLSVTKSGIEHFNQLDRDYIKNKIEHLCNESLMGKWKKRKWLRKTKEKKCEKKLGKLYDKYKKELEGLKEIHLWKLRDFLLSLNKYVDRKDQLLPFFGKDNVFFYGSFNAKTQDGQTFTTYFHSGKYNGEGVIANFQRQGGLARLPASITP